MRCSIWYHLYNLKNVINTHGGVLILVKLQLYIKLLFCFREVPGITELLNPLHPAVVAERNARALNPPEQRRLNRPKQGQTLFNVNKGSLFVTSKKRNGKHFTIHPEWY